MRKEEEKSLVTIRNVRKDYKDKKNCVHAVSDVSLDIYRGESMALVGESGCGKTTLGKMVLGLLKVDSGEILFDGDNIEKLKKNDLKKVRSRMQMVFQDPYASLDPRMTAAEIIEEPLRSGRIPKAERWKKVCALLEKVEIPLEYANRYPNQFSGGQRQRIGIARALAREPEFIVCDEPVSALDVSIQAQILNLLKSLQKEMNLTYLFISHDLGVVRYISNRVCVMFLGQVCEIGTAEEVYDFPRHPYTQLLLESTPKLGRRLDEDEALPETEKMQSNISEEKGCSFFRRCRRAQKQCAVCKPSLTGTREHKTACFYPLGDKRYEG